MKILDSTIFLKELQHGVVDPKLIRLYPICAVLSVELLHFYYTESKLWIADAATAESSADFPTFPLCQRLCTTVQELCNMRKTLGTLLSE
jgi:hypothetical protein